MPQFDKTQALQHITALGYTESSTLFLTAFFPAGDTRTQTDKGRKAQGTFATVAPKIQGWIDEGRGVYLVANGGGHKQDEIKECRAVFYEHDDLDKDIQRDLWQVLNLPQPTLQIDTGGKSIHSYWVLTEAITPKEWKRLQTDLLNMADADRSLKNPNRVMRLAGCPHYSIVDGEHTHDGDCHIVANDGDRYSFHTMRSSVPEPPKPEPKPSPSQPLRPYTEDPRDEDARVLSALEAIPRRQPGSGTYEESVRVLMALQAHYGQEKGLQMAQRWSPDEDWGESLDRKIRGMKHDGVKLGTLYHIAKSHGWVDPRQPKPVAVSSTKPVTLDETPANDIGRRDNGVCHGQQKQDGTSAPEIVTFVRDILEKTENEGERAIALAALAKEHGLTVKSIDAARKDWEGQQAIAESKPAQPPTVDVEMSTLVGDKLAAEIEQAASSASIDPMMIFHYLLGAAGSLVGANCRAWIKDGHMEPAIYWPVIVEESGEGKTRAYNLVSQWFKKHQVAINEEYEIAKKQKDKEIKKWQQDKTTTDDPPTPTKAKHQCLINQATTEALIKAIANNNGRGALVFRDEFSATFKMGQYKARGGDDEETLLELYDGGTINVLRASEENSLFAPNSHACFAGGTQPGIFNEVFRDANDSRGKQARFAFIVPRQTQKRYNRTRHERLALTDTLDGIYTNILDEVSGLGESVPLSDKAYDVWCDYYDKIRGIVEGGEVSEAVRVWLKKHASRAARVALILHVLDVAQGYVMGQARQVISVNTMRRAIAFCEYLSGQFGYLQQQADGGSVDGVVTRIQSKARAYGVVKSRDLYRTHCRADLEAIAKDQGRPVAEVTKNLMEQAAESDGFILQKEGRGAVLLFERKTEEVETSDIVTAKRDNVQKPEQTEVVESVTKPVVTAAKRDNDPKEGKDNDHEIVQAWVLPVGGGDPEWVRGTITNEEIIKGQIQYTVESEGILYYSIDVRPIAQEVSHAT